MGARGLTSNLCSLCGEMGEWLQPDPTRPIKSGGRVLTTPRGCLVRVKAEHGAANPPLATALATRSLRRRAWCDRISLIALVVT